jgi:hypothetical protein
MVTEMGRRSDISGRNYKFVNICRWITGEQRHLNDLDFDVGIVVKYVDLRKRECCNMESLETVCESIECLAFVNSLKTFRTL